MVMWLVRLRDLGRATERARPEALDGRPLVHVGAADGELVGAQLVGGLGVGDRGVEQLEDVGGDGARSVLEDRLSLLDALAANVVHHEPRLARGGAHVLARARTMRSPSGGERLRRAVPVEVSAEPRVGASWPRAPRRRRLRRPPRGVGASAAPPGLLGASPLRVSGLGGLLGVPSTSAAASFSAAGAGRVPAWATSSSARRAISSAFVPLFGRPRASSSALSSSTFSDSQPPSGGGLTLSGVTASSPCRCPRGRGTSGWERTRRACGRPSTRR